MEKFIRKNLFVIIVSAVLTAVNIFFANLPLLNILSYESSTLNAVLFSAISGIYWLNKKEDFKVKYHIFNFAIIIIIPFIILSISTILCQNCPFGDGLLFYIFISIPSIFVGIAIAELSNFISKKLKYVFFFIGWFIVLLGFLPELYYNPQVYFYNPIFAYYPGVIYDQGIEITKELILYRFINLLFSVGIIYIIRLNNNFNNIRKAIVITIVMMIYVILSQFKTAFNFSTDLDRTKTELGDVLTTKHFDIIIPDSLTNAEREIVKYEHEFYYKSISEILDTTLDSKITSIIYGTGAQKKKLFGSGNADVAKPWLNQIYLNFDNYNKSLKHEIAHIFSANYARGLFNIPSNLNPGMIEGFAMAVENNYDNFDIDYLAAIAYKNEYRISLENLFEGFSFFSNASSLSYIYAGSFLKYLAEKSGWNNIKKIYSGDDFNSVYGLKIDKLEEEYYTFLEQYPVDSNRHKSNYYYGRVPLIKKYCARAAAKDHKLAYEYFKAKDFHKSAETYLNIYNYTGTYSALVGYAQCKSELEENDEAIKILSNELPKFEGTGYYYYLEFLLADFYALENNFANAADYYEKIIDQNPHKIYLRSALVKSMLLAQGDSILNYYMNDREFKKNKLIELVSATPDNSVLQLLAAFRDYKDDEYPKIRDIIKDALKKNKYSADTYLDLSKFSYNYLDFQKSIFYTELALASSDRNRKPIIEEHLSKLKWIVNDHN